MTALSSATSRPTLSVAFVVMLAIWLEIVPRDSVGRMLETKFRVASVHHRNALVVAMLLTGNMRYVQVDPCALGSFWLTSFSN
jgi:hypothetical protein